MFSSSLPSSPFTLLSSLPSRRSTFSSSLLSSPFTLLSSLPSKALHVRIERALEAFDAPIEFALEPPEALERLPTKRFERELRVLTLFHEVLGDLVEASIDRLCQRVELALDAIDPLG